jgi:hypothetical protein
VWPKCEERSVASVSEEDKHFTARREFAPRAAAQKLVKFCTFFRAFLFFQKKRRGVRRARRRPLRECHGASLTIPAYGPHYCIRRFTRPQASEIFACSGGRAGSGGWVPARPRPSRLGSAVDTPAWARAWAWEA